MIRKRMRPSRPDQSAQQINPTTATKSLTAIYRKAKHNGKARYIHKYYLPRELKPRVFLADICALMNEINDWCVWERRLPETLPSCVIHYSDLCLDKTIPDHEVRLVLQAMIAYFEDARGELTEDENQAALKLNAWLTEWEKDLKAECCQIRKEMDQKLSSGGQWLNEYDIDVDVWFFVRDDDYAYDNDSQENDHDVDKDSSMLCEIDLLICLPSSPEDSIDLYQIDADDDMDYNDLRSLNPIHDRKNSIYRAKHCQTFHELYSHQGIPMKHLGRIGTVCVDIKVLHQNAADLDVPGGRRNSAQSWLPKTS